MVWLDLAPNFNYFCFFFFYQVFFHRHWRFIEVQGKGGDHLLFLSTTSTHSWILRHIYLQLCMWDEYHLFLIATFVFTRLLRDEIYHLIELPFDWLFDDPIFICLLDELILGFSYSDLTWETGGFELCYLW